MEAALDDSCESDTAPAIPKAQVDFEDAQDAPKYALQDFTRAGPILVGPS